MQADEERSERQLRLPLRRLSAGGCLLLLLAATASCSRPEETVPPGSAEPPAEPSAASPSSGPGPQPQAAAGESVGAERRAGGPVTAPPAGSPQAREVLEALRPAVEAELGQPVRFEVSSLRTDGVWAYLSAAPRTPEGRPLDYSGTRHAADIEEGLFDDWLCALLERADGEWQVRALEIGATDAPFVDWPERYGAPERVVIPTAE